GQARQKGLHGRHQRRQRRICLGFALLFRSRAARAPNLEVRQKAAPAPPDVSLSFSVRCSRFRDMRIVPGLGVVVALALALPAAASALSWSTPKVFVSGPVYAPAVGEGRNGTVVAAWEQYSPSV